MEEQMKFNSTRNREMEVTSAFAIKNGLASDGGLYVPEEFPKVSLNDLEMLLDKDYIERAKFILSKYLTDFTADEIEYCVTKAYTSNLTLKARLRLLN